jgi:hypothetical protein
MAHTFWEMIKIFLSIAQKIWLSNFQSPSLTIVGDQKFGIEFFGQFLKNNWATTKMFWAVMISFPLLDQLPLLIRLLNFFGTSQNIFWANKKN